MNFAHARDTKDFVRHSGRSRGKDGYETRSTDCTFDISHNRDRQLETIGLPIARTKDVHIQYVSDGRPLPSRAASAIPSLSRFPTLAL